MNQSDIKVDLVGYYGDDNVVANAARVSFHKEASNYSKEQNDKLIRYLATHKHFSPFNHTFISMRIKAPIFVARQLVKHRFMPWNEVSRRYVDEEPEFYVPKEYRLKAENVKQGSSDKTTSSFINPWGGEECEINHVHRQHVEASLTLYHSLLDQKICAEQARMVLPQNMMTEWIWSGTLGAWCDMLRLRLDPHTQAESRIVANKVKAIIEPLFPVSVKALLSNE